MDINTISTLIVVPILVEVITGAFSLIAAKITANASKDETNDGNKDENPSPKKGVPSFAFAGVGILLIVGAIVSCVYTWNQFQRFKNMPDVVLHNGHMYRICDESCTWSSAKENCEKLGGHLVTINSETELNFINKLITIGDKEYYWLGASDKQTEGYWVWVTGEPLDDVIECWESNQPDNYDGKEHYLICSRDSKGWNDIGNEGHHWWRSYTDENHTPAEKNEDGTTRLHATKNVGYICEWE